MPARYPKPAAGGTPLAFRTRGLGAVLLMTAAVACNRDTRNFPTRVFRSAGPVKALVDWKGQHYDQPDFRESSYPGFLRLGDTIVVSGPPNTFAEFARQNKVVPIRSDESDLPDGFLTFCRYGLVGRDFLRVTLSQAEISWQRSFEGRLSGGRVSQQAVAAFLGGSAARGLLDKVRQPLPWRTCGRGMDGWGLIVCFRSRAVISYRIVFNCPESLSDDARLFRVLWESAEKDGGAPHLSIFEVAKGAR